MSLLNSLVLSLTLIVGLASAVSTVGCSSAEKNHETEVGPRMSDLEYRIMVEKNTKTAQKYEGFYNTLEVRSTFINSDVQAAILQKQSEILQWDSKTAQAAREKMFQENSNSTKFFVSFFVPTRRLNDLHKPNTIWKIYLEANGEKYEGKATKRTEPLEALQALFPAHSRWAIPYDVTFSVPLSAVDKSNVKLTFTSSVAQAELNF
ncbi:MAG: hypothetical protein AABZ31_05915 [Bdellovibrionota bacterium]